MSYLCILTFMFSKNLLLPALPSLDGKSWYWVIPAYSRAMISSLQFLTTSYEKLVHFSYDSYSILLLYASFFCNIIIFFCIILSRSDSDSFLCLSSVPPAIFWYSLKIVYNFEFWPASFSPSFSEFYCINPFNFYFSSWTHSMVNKCLKLGWFDGFGM